MSGKRILLRLIAALPAGEKLPISRMAREIDATAAVVIDLVQALIADGRLDRATLRPTAHGEGYSVRKGFSPAELFGIVCAEAKRRGTPKCKASIEIFGHASQLSTMQHRCGRAATAATIAKIETWLQRPIDAPAEEEEHAPPEPPAPCEGAESQAKAAAPSPLPTGAELCAEIEAAARQAGVGPAKFVSPIANYPKNFLDQLRTAKRPRPLTVDRVRALIAGYEPPPPKPRPEGVVTVTRAERRARGLPLSGREIKDEKTLSATMERREKVEEAQLEAHVARVTRQPGETLADAVKREAAEREERFRNATRLTTAHPLPIGDRIRRIGAEVDADIEAEQAAERERELDELPTASSVLRRAQRDWPDQCEKVKAIAAEIGVTLAEAWRRVIAAGVECLSDPEAI